MRRAILTAIGGVMLLTGCVERKMTITSEPAGALVVMNNEEVGRTPFTRDFTFYGTYDVELRAEGYQTLSTKSRVIAPWWQWPPIDLIAELMPWHPTDRRTLHYLLSPVDTASMEPGVLVNRAEAMKGSLRAGRFLPATKPTAATRLTTKPATRPSPATQGY